MLLHAFITTKIDGGKLGQLYASATLPKESSPRKLRGSHSWPGCFGEKKSSCLCLESNLVSSVVQRVAIAAVAPPVENK